MNDAVNSYAKGYEYRKDKDGNYVLYDIEKNCPSQSDITTVIINERHERSKREDIEELGHEFVNVPLTVEVWCARCKEEDHVIRKTMMRCSEH